MMSTGEDVKAAALRQQGWTISAIGRHLGRDRKTGPGLSGGPANPGCPAAVDVRSAGPGHDRHSPSGRRLHPELGQRPREPLSGALRA